MLDTVGRLLGEARDWPERELRVTAVEARAGEVEAFDARSGVNLLEAVVASCAVPVVWPPVTVAGRRWMTGAVAPPPTSSSRTAVGGCWPSCRSRGRWGRTRAQPTRPRGSPRTARASPC
ncbi:patatin-like phospholipase family protein [Streptomyces griseoincarnatus]